MQDDAVGSAAATLLQQLLLHLKAELIKELGESLQSDHSLFLTSVLINLLTGSVCCIYFAVGCALHILLPLVLVPCQLLAAP